VSDPEGFAVRYRDTGRTDRPVFEYAGRLILENGQEFRPFSAGGNNPIGGRTRYVAVDWNGDGLLDLAIIRPLSTSTWPRRVRGEEVADPWPGRSSWLDPRHLFLAGAE
jgi:hypothetical protein